MSQFFYRPDLKIGFETHGWIPIAFVASFYLQTSIANRDSYPQTQAWGTFSHKTDKTPVLR